VYTQNPCCTPFTYAVGVLQLEHKIPPRSRR